MCAAGGISIGHPGGYNSDYWLISCIMHISVVVVVTLKIIYYSKIINSLLVLSVSLSFFFYGVFLYASNESKLVSKNVGG